MNKHERNEVLLHQIKTLIEEAMLNEIDYDEKIPMIVIKKLSELHLALTVRKG